MTKGEAPLRVSVKSDVGKLRSNNQDAYYAETVSDERAASHGRLYIVADGMGGHAAGEVASRLAVETASRVFYQCGADEVAADPGPCLRRAFQEANRAILKEGSQNLEHYGMGTTCTAVLFRGDEYWLCHVGDSRVYRYRDDELEALTADHTLLRQMLDQGELTPKEAARISIRHILVRAMGIEANVQLDICEKPRVLEPGDRLLICSDGLHGVLPDREIEQILRGREGDAAAEALVDQANERGGPDNITVLLVER